MKNRNECRPYALFRAKKISKRRVEAGVKLKRTASVKRRTESPGE